jgi:hypothetical protein
MAAKTIMNINAFLSSFFSSNTGTLASLWREDDFDGVMSAWGKWCSEKDTPFLTKGKVTKKTIMMEELVTDVVKNFVETFGDVLFAESVWDTLTEPVYLRLVISLVNDQITQDALKGVLAKLKTVKSTTKKEGGSTRNKSAYLYCCAHFRKSVKEMNPDMSPQEITKLLGKKWETISKSTEGADKDLFDKFTQIAKEDKERYELESPKISKPKTEKKPKAEKKPTKKRGKSAWVVFCDIKRSDVKEKLGAAATNQQVMFELGQMWASNDFTELKIVAEQKSLEDKERVKALFTPTSSDDESEETEETGKSVDDAVTKPTLTTVEKVLPSAAEKLNILLSEDDDEELEEEDEEYVINGSVGMMEFE